MPNALPTTLAGCNAMSCIDLKNGYLALTAAQKKAWLEAAGPAGCCRVTHPDPADVTTIQINIWSPANNDFTRCNWDDVDVLA
jgi:hypothetical protein